MKTRNIFMIGNDFSRRFRRCRIRICNNLKVTKMKGGLTSKIPLTQPIQTYRTKVGLYESIIRLDEIRLD